MDPFDAGLKFSTIKALGHIKMDFLILLMLGLDARVNFKAYLEDVSNPRIGELVDAPDWRTEWRREAAQGRRNVIHFLMRKFDEAMVRLGYQSTRIDDALPVKVHKKQVMIYMLVFYSKHKLGQDFWKATLSGMDPQIDLRL